VSFGQGILNGSFENNTKTECTYNQNSTNFNLAMPNVNSYGTTPQIDIQNSINCDIIPQHGNWCIGIASFPWGGSDAITLELLSPLSIDSLYHLKFWTFNNTTYASTNGIALDSIRIGLTTNNNSSNKTIYTSFPSTDTWVEHTISFVADSNYTFISVDMKNDFNSATWIQIDNFSITNATIGGEVFGTDTRTECDSLVWLDGYIYYTDNNTATYNLIGGGANYKDSIVSLDLTIVNSSTGTDYKTECYAYTWIDGINYTADNNTATFTLTNSVGCDSIVTLDLTVNNTTSYDYQTACTSYTWIDGNTYTSNNNTATYILPNSVGCDSIITLDLTINNSIFVTDTQTACDSYLWIDGNTYTTSNNSATYILTNSAGCDSLVTLDLTINNVSDIATSTSGITISANNVGATYQWLDCDNNNAIINDETGQSFTAITNGNYAVELTENGCVDTSACTLISTVGLIENNFGNNLQVYPNPTSGYFSINLDDVYENVEVLITDLSGQVIHSKTMTKSQTLNLSIEEPAGTYIVYIQAEDKKAIIRLIKE